MDLKELFLGMKALVGTFFFLTLLHLAALILMDARSDTLHLPCWKHLYHPGIPLWTFPVQLAHSGKHASKVVPALPHQ